MSLKEKIQKAKQAGGELNQALGQTCKKLSLLKEVEIRSDAQIEIQYKSNGKELPRYVDFSPNEALKLLEWLKIYEQEIKELNTLFTQEK